MKTTLEFNNIPKGATHYRQECDNWYFNWAKCSGKGWLIYSEERPWWAYWGTFPVEELIPIITNPQNQLKAEWVESIIENKEELYKHLGYLYDTMVGNNKEN